MRETMPFIWQAHATSRLSLNQMLNERRPDVANPYLDGRHTCLMDDNLQSTTQWGRTLKPYNLRQCQAQRRIIALAIGLL